MCSCIPLERARLSFLYMMCRILCLSPCLKNVFFPKHVCEWKKIIEPMIVFKEKKVLKSILLVRKRNVEGDARRIFFADEVRGEFLRFVVVSF